ncbi:MAG: TIGR01777 family protein [Acidimicrobiia bacterium]|nr:TIGR01777 family protein [Actinomycetota bacterium]NDH48790.1 TIGR01777 family protein [Acidimicrobiia bacterium]
MSRTIAITGASGLIGSALTSHLRDKGENVIKLVRREPRSKDEAFWNPVDGKVDLDALEGVDSIVHLAGAGVGDKRWSAAYKSEILNSRLYGTSTIANAAEQLKVKSLISSSAIGWYGETGNRAVTENDRGGDDFLAHVCLEWERAADAAPSVRTVKIRTGLVLDPTGGALGRMMPLFRFGLGGKLGSGKQWWSWITLHDQVRAIDYLIDSDLSGPVNLTAPNPATNSEFTAALARALRRPALLPVPGFALKVALGGFSTEILGSKRVLPERLNESGFIFDFPHLAPALAKLAAH